MKNLEECKGCRYYTDVCLLKYDAYLTNKCVCTNCLIKMMCKIMCKSRKDLYENLTKETRIELTKANRDDLLYKRDVRERI